MDTGELAWAITASAMVLLMTPGVAFFYGGLVKAKSVVSMMMMSFGAMGLISVRGLDHPLTGNAFLSEKVC